MSVSLLDKLRDLPLAFVDVETTGASTDYGDRVIEVGIVRIEGGRRVAEYQQLIDPHRRIAAGVVALTGITQEMVSGQPGFGDCLSRMIELMGGAVVVGHNVRFDLSFLENELPPSVVDSPAWLNSELAHHVAEYGRWLAGPSEWRTLARGSEQAAIRKAHTIDHHVAAVAQNWSLLTPAYRRLHAMLLRRDLQRLRFLTDREPVPPTPSLDRTYLAASDPVSKFFVLRDQVPISPATRESLSRLARYSVWGIRG